MWNLTRWETDSGVHYEIPHSNLHSCLTHVGFCTPFVSNTPALSTHSTALVDNFRPDSSRSDGDWVNCTFTGSLSLNAASYTIITHVRFFTSEGGVTIQADLAQGLVRTVYQTADVCQPGHYASEGECIQCPSGTFSDMTNASDCEVCPAGKYAAADPDDADGAGVASGASACVECPEGFYSAGSGSTICSVSMAMPDR